MLLVAMPGAPSSFFPQKEIDLRTTFGEIKMTEIWTVNSQLGSISRTTLLSSDPSLVLQVVVLVVHQLSSNYICVTLYN